MFIAITIYYVMLNATATLKKAAVVNKKKIRHLRRLLEEAV
jgi:hypothetical protein